MPQLVYFLACETMLLEEEGQVPSLINVFDQFNFPAPPPEMENAQVPLKWQLVSYWRRLPEDEAKTFQQRTLIVSPDGKEVAPSIIEFSVPAVSHRNNVRVFGFPIAPAGDYHAQLFIREVGREEWEQVADYLIRVNHVQEPITKTP
jgi:hypothetical protein